MVGQARGVIQTTPDERFYLMKKRYLAPLDGSRLGEKALPWARLLAERFDREIELLQCYQPLASVYMLPEVAIPAPVYHDQAGFHEQIDSYLQSQKESLPEGLAHTTRCEGDPAAAILDRAESGDIEAVVISSHGRGGLGRWLLGSVATKVLRGCTVPVLVINSATEVASRPEIKNILVPVDGSKLAEAAIPEAIKIAERFSATIHLYQAVTLAPIGHPQVDAAVAFNLENTKEYLQELKAQFPEAKMETRAKVTGPKIGIESEAKDCDLVVLSSHGRSGIKRWMLGSVTEGLVQSLHTPMLVIYQRNENS